MRRPRLPYELIERLSPSAADQSPVVPFAYAMEVETDIKYSGYIERQKQQVEQGEKYDSIKLPSDFNYLELDHLSKEAREKLNRIRPETLGQASRIGGVSPADISVLLVKIEQARRALKAVAEKV